MKGAVRTGALWLLAMGGPAADRVSVAAEDPVALIREVRESHPSVRAARQELRQAEQRLEVAHGDKYPEVRVSGDYGREVEQGEASSEQRLENARQASVSATQLVTDFGATAARIEAARERVDRARRQLQKARNQQALAAAQAWVGLHRAQRTLVYARRTESNIRQQANVEQVRVDTGSGVDADVLQAKRQLAGARARRVNAQTAVDEARQRFREIFDRASPPPDDMLTLKVDSAAMPKTRSRALKRARRKNLDIAVARQQVDVAGAEREQTHRSVYSPTLELVAQRTWREDDNGVPGEAREWSALLQFNFPFNLGMTAGNETAAASAKRHAAMDRLKARIRAVERDVRNAWNAYHAAQDRVRHLSEQAELAAAFLEVARKERKLGKRSLIDVLSGETSLINARSSAASERAKVTLQALELLSLLGKLPLEGLRVVQETAAEQARQGAKTGGEAATPGASQDQ